MPASISNPKNTDGERLELRNDWRISFLGWAHVVVSNSWLGIEASTKELTERGLKTLCQRALCRPLSLLKGSELHEPNGGSEFGLVQRGFETADRIGFPHGSGHLQEFPSEFRDSGNSSAAAA